MRGTQVGVFRQPNGIQMDEGGEWENKVWADLRSDRRIKLQFRGVGARPLILERRNELAGAI